MTPLRRIETISAKPAGKFWREHDARPQGKK
jgi:hypothetical protein